MRRSVTFFTSLAIPLLVMKPRTYFSRFCGAAASADSSMDDLWTNFARRSSNAVFAIGSRPTLPDGDTQVLVGLIAADPTPFTTRLAAKINRGLLDGDSAHEIELEREELVEIADALSADPELLLDVPAFKPLYDEVTAALEAQASGS